MINIIELILGLLAAVAGLALLGRRLPVPLPILLVIGGLMLGLIPGLPRVALDPELVFVFFLPPLLYPAALFTSWRDFRANLRPIVTILEGESLVNDATALVAYRFALAALVTGSFSLGSAAGHFFIVGLGGILIGLIVGWLAAVIQKPIDDPPIEITLSLLTPFAAYLPAEQLGVSGVLAVVTAGLYHGWRIPEITTSRTRLQAGPVWEMIEFLLNGFIFILIGLQLPEVLRHLAGRSISQLVWYAVLISLAVIVIRILWVFPATYLPRLLFKRIRQRDPYPAWQHVAVVAWTGMRGVVSLAAALALPLTLGNGSAFPGRDLLLFLTFIVILATLVVQGLSLPPIIRWLGIEDDRT